MTKLISLKAIYFLEEALKIGGGNEEVGVVH